MRKISFIFILLLTALFVVSCDKNKKDDDTTDDGIRIILVSGSFSGNTYTYVYDVNQDNADIIRSIGYTTAHDLYLELSEEIGTSTVFLNLTFKSGNETILVLNYQVNRNMENMGLTLLNETP